MKKKETTGVQTNGRQTGQSRKRAEVDDRKIVRAVKKTPKISVTAITNNLYSKGIKLSQSTVGRRLREQKYRGQIHQIHTTRCKPNISSKNRIGTCKELRKLSTRFLEHNLTD